MPIKETLNMNIDLKGKKALVGGSSAGIGKAIAIQLATSGASVTLMSRSADKLKAIIADLPTAQGQKHQFLKVDFTDFESYKTSISTYFQSNTVDILVNNTQGPAAGSALVKSIDDYQDAFDLLFKTVVYTTELALESMQNNRYGRIINVSSVSVREPLSYLALSNSIRSAVTAWAKSLSMDIGPYNITINNVLTGYFNTDRIENIIQNKASKSRITPEEVRKEMESEVAVKRMGEPEEYGYLVAFLASDEAAYLSGINIPIDGGRLKSL